MGYYDRGLKGLNKYFKKFSWFEIPNQHTGTSIFSNDFELQTDTRNEAHRFPFKPLTLEG